MVLNTAHRAMEKLTENRKDIPLKPGDCPALLNCQRAANNVANTNTENGNRSSKMYWFKN